MSTTATAPARIPWLDTTRGLAFLMVIYSHLDYSNAYMGLGKWYRHVEDQADARMKTVYLLPLLAIYVLAIHFMDLHVSYAGSPTMCDALLVTLIGLTLIIYGCKRFAPHNRLLLFVGANSLLYFAFHGKCYAVLQTVLYKVLAHSQVALTPLQTTLMGFVITLADALILIIPVLLVNHFCPQILGRGFKLGKTKTSR